MIPHGNVDPRLLLPFVVLAEELHFGRAARRLHLTQSALSQQLQRLERQLGVELVERDPRRVTLTQPGHVFLRGARDALRIIAGAVGEARRVGGSQDTLRIGVDIHLPESLIRCLRSFGSARSDLEVRLSIQQQDDVIQDLESGRSDLAVIWTAPPGESAVGLAFTGLATIELHGVVRRDDPVAAGRSLTRAQLVPGRLIMYRPSRATRGFYDAFLDELTDTDGGRPEVVHVPGADGAQAAMLDGVEKSDGFTLCVAGELDPLARPRLVELPFDPPVSTDVVAAWRGPERPAALTDIAAWLKGWDAAPTSEPASIPGRGAH